MEMLLILAIAVRPLANFYVWILHIYSKIHPDSVRIMPGAACGQQV
jgi:hypothetical protein